jgi:hypothetical protein
MNTKLSFTQSLKDYLRDISVYVKTHANKYLRNNLKIGYKVPKDHEFIPDQSKLGMHLAILDPTSMIVEDIMTTNPKFGNLLKMGPIFIEINHEQKNKLDLNSKNWIYNEDEKDFFEIKEIDPIPLEEWNKNG